MMSVPSEDQVSYANIGRERWFRRGVLASQTGYVIPDP